MARSRLNTAEGHSNANFLHLHSNTQTQIFYIYIYIYIVRWSVIFDNYSTVDFVMVALEKMKKLENIGS